MRTIPLVLSEASLTLWPAAASGDPILSEPVWIGARVEGLEIEGALEEVESTASGAAQRQYEPGAESWLIRIQRIWVVATNSLKGFDLRRGRFVLQIVHQCRKAGTYHRLTFYGVTMRSQKLQSKGLMEYAEAQEFRAEWSTQEGGTLPATPTVEWIAETPAIVFTCEGSLAPGAYLTGAYAFDRPVRLTTAFAIGLASQGQSTVLRLMMDGMATAHNLALAQGSGESSGTMVLGLVVPAGSVLRWMAESAPLNNQASRVSVAVNLEAL